MTTAALVADPRQLLDYVNSVAAVTSYASAVAQSTLPALVLTPDWYSDYTTAFELAQAHALTWVDGVLPELVALPGALLDADPLVQMRQQNVLTALASLAADPSSAADLQSAQAAMLALQSILAPTQQAMDGASASLSAFNAQLSTDIETLQAMADSAGAAAGSDAAAVAKLTDIVEELRHGIALEQHIASLENLLKGDVALFVVVVAATVGWLGGPVVEGLIGMAAIGAIAAIGDRLASEADIVALQNQIGNVQKEISAVDVEIATITATITTFNQLIEVGGGAGAALTTVIADWSGQTGQIDTIAADLSDASSDLTAAQLFEAQNAVNDLGVRWAELIDAMSLLAGVAITTASRPVVVNQ